MRVGLHQHGRDCGYRPGGNNSRGLRRNSRGPHHNTDRDGGRWRWRRRRSRQPQCRHPPRSRGNAHSQPGLPAPCAPPAARHRRATGGPQRRAGWSARSAPPRSRCRQSCRCRPWYSQPSGSSSLLRLRALAPCRDNAKARRRFPGARSRGRRRRRNVGTACFMACGGGPVRLSSRLRYDIEPDCSFTLQRRHLLGIEGLSPTRSSGCSTSPKSSCSSTDRSRRSGNPARPHPDQPVLRGLDADPILVRDRRQAPRRRRDEHVRRQFLGEEGRNAHRHGGDAERHASGRADRAPQRLRRGGTARPQGRLLGGERGRRGA